MSLFFERKSELAELDEIASEPTAQFLILYGRRRVGKTTLLLHWAERCGYFYIYWVANRLSPALQLQSFSQIIHNTLHPNSPVDNGFSYPSWENALQQVVQSAQSKRVILIIDEFTYATEAEPGLASIIQNTWDHHLKESQLFLILSGSHISLMTELLQYQAPLYGRFTGHLHLKPLPFSVLTHFLPKYGAAERVATYAILGGIPAYIERFSDSLSIKENVNQRILRPTGIFRVDPLFLIQDQVREPRNYLSVLHAIGSGAHTLEDIAKNSGLPKQNVSTYLGRLAALHMVERRTPVTLEPKRRQNSRLGRWYLLNAFLRFYFRFIEPNQRALELELYDTVWEEIGSQLRAFIGMTTFEELCRDWLLIKAKNNQLPFMPEDIGSHWSKTAQVDVVAIHWRKKSLILGECKWGTNRVGLGVIRELIEEKTPKVLATLPDNGKGWTVYHMFFARTGFTEPAQTMAKQADATLITLAEIDTFLSAQ